VEQKSDCCTDQIADSITDVMLFGPDVNDCGEGRQVDRADNHAVNNSG
jgi:hypothetical protein